jgi:hypothetical protein
LSSKPSDPLSAIDSAAALAEESARDIPIEDRINDLEAQIAKIEPLLEQLQKNAQTATNLANYINDLRDEQLFFNKARYWLAVLAGVVVVLLIALLWIAIWHSKSPLLTAPPGAIAAFVLGVISGIVFLVNSFTKGVFRSTAERHADGFLPPALEKVFDVYNKVTGKAN